MDKLRKKVDREDIREPTQVHFGPEEDKVVATHHINRKREMAHLVNSNLTQQIAANQEGIKRRLEREKLADSVNMGAVNSKLRNEKLENLGNRRQQM